MPSCSLQPRSAELVAYKRATSAAALTELATSVAHDAGIADPRVWSEEGRVEISVVDEADALRADGGGAVGPRRVAVEGARGG